MLSLVDPLGKRTAAAALRNALYLMPLGALATWVGLTTPAFTVEAAIISGALASTAASFYRCGRLSDLIAASSHPAVILAPSA